MSRVLIVDDSLTVRMDLAEAFEDAGFSVTTGASVADARAALGERRSDLLVLDVVLPDGDGVDLLAELRSSADLGAIPIILLSTEAEVAARIRGISHGANEYVGKPYDASYVVARASALLHLDRARGPRDRPRVLVIDDSATYREALAAALAAEGYDATLAASGEEGLRRAAEVRPDAIVVDGVMPGLDGAAVVRRLRLDPGLAATPCLMLTAAEGPEAELAGLEAGADAYASKADGVTVALARLKAALRTARDTRERRAEASVLGPKRILAVDDSATYLGALTEVLRAEGYEVVRALSGEDGLALLAVEPVDCVLMDLLMPGMSGTEACRRIKAAQATRNVPLIMLTARDDPEAMIAGIDAGADDYVSKAADVEVLRARIRAQLRRKHLEDETRRAREEMLQKDAEMRAASELAATRETLLARLATKNAELEELARELRMFAYSVSHDLRQPLRGVDRFSAALLRTYGDRLDESGRHYLRRIRAGAERMGQIIEGILALSRVTRQPVAPTTVDLTAVAAAVFERLREAEPERQVVVTVAPELVVMADPKLIESVLENLLGNAWKFTAGCTPAHIEVGSTGPGGELYVRDDGIGFDMAQADRLFTPFQRLHGDADGGGAGIGLATVRRIIERHGGTVRAVSEPGRGATFFVSLGDQLVG